MQGSEAAKFLSPAALFVGGDVSPMNQQGLGGLVLWGAPVSHFIIIFFGGRSRGVTHHVESDPEEEPLD